MENRVFNLLFVIRCNFLHCIFLWLAKSYARQISFTSETTFGNLLATLRPYLVKVANLGVGQNLKWKEVELCGMNCSSHGNNYEVFLNFSFPVEEFLRSMLAVSYSRIVWTGLYVQSLSFVEIVIGMMWCKIFKNKPSKICGRQSLKDLKWYGLSEHFLKAVFHKF